MVPTTVLTRSGLILLNAARPVNIVQPRIAVNNAGPMKNVINNAYSTARRPFNKITASNNSNFNKRVHTVNDKNVNAARPNAVVNIARPKAVFSVVKGNKGNAGNPQQDLKDKGVIDSGCSRHMTGNISYLTEYEEIDGGFGLFHLHLLNVPVNKTVSNKERGERKNKGSGGKKKGRVMGEGVGHEVEEGREKVCKRQDNWKCVITRLTDDLLALDLKVNFDFSDQRLELTATFSIPTYSETSVLTSGLSLVFVVEVVVGGRVDFVSVVAVTLEGLASADTAFEGFQGLKLFIPKSWE
ncbi:hypothetical protein Tco_1226826 [Tanacetum coccineum]